jgi:hypothetical protein
MYSVLSPALALARGQRAIHPSAGLTIADRAGKLNEPLFLRARLSRGYARKLGAEPIALPPRRRHAAMRCSWVTPFGLICIAIIYQ